MTLRTSKHLLVSAATAATLTLGACGSVEETNREIENALFSHGNWEQLAPAYENRVETVTIEHAISFPTDRAGLDKSERRRLVDFLQRSEIGGADEVIIVASRLAEGHHDPLTAARIEFIKGELDAFGIVGTDDPAGGNYDRLTEDQVTIVVDRHIVVTPDCGQAQPDAGDRPLLTSGCSDVANLGLMVADPRDLVRGRPVGPMDGEFAAKGVFDYRSLEDEDKVLEETSTSTTGDEL